MAAGLVCTHHGRIEKRTNSSPNQSHHLARSSASSPVPCGDSIPEWDSATRKIRTSQYDLTERSEASKFEVKVRPRVAGSEFSQRKGGFLRETREQRRSCKSGKTLLETHSQKPSLVTGKQTKFQDVETRSPRGTAALGRNVPVADARRRSRRTSLTGGERTFTDGPIGPFVECHEDRRASQWKHKQH